ncbi:hypothetical protein BD626DRAFT_222290 [Schizophyllum amplum]|uniref:Uncharacterized protein n=1 Tax=Schizophyllum amplum TaxID=97359 RepID=A0A550BXJ4_9AGAR|nr:hypothetical protein BD626DRAFT_222290 [Auriculariopsis ampla]
MASVVVGMGAGVEGVGYGAGGAGLGNKETGLGVESSGAARTKKGSKKEREAQMDLKAREWLKENDPEVADAPSAKDLRYAREQVQEFEMQEMLRERREAKALGAAIAEALAIVDPRSFGADISNTADEQQSDGFMVKRVAPQSAAVEMWPEGANSLLVGNAGTEASADNSTVELPTFGASSEKRFTKAELAGKVDITKHADTLLHVYRRNFVYSQLYRENIDRLDRLSQDDAYMRDRGYIMTESQMAYNKKGKDQDPLCAYACSTRWLGRGLLLSRRRLRRRPLRPRRTLTPRRSLATRRALRPTMRTLTPRWTSRNTRWTSKTTSGSPTTSRKSRRLAYDAGVVLQLHARSAGSESYSRSFSLWAFGHCLGWF